MSIGFQRRARVGTNFQVLVYPSLLGRRQLFFYIEGKKRVDFFAVLHRFLPKERTKTSLPIRVNPCSSVAKILFSVISPRLRREQVFIANPSAFPLKAPGPGRYGT